MENNNRFIPGQALSFADIQKRFNGQQVYLTPDGYISILMKNGLGLQIMMVEEFEKHLDFSVKIGRMNKQGVIFGKYQNSTISLNRKIADNFTLDHETFHFLREMGVITPKDIQLLHVEFQILKNTGILAFQVNNSEEENLANTFAQVLNDREKYRRSLIGRIIQKATDFVDGMLHIGQMTIRKMAREVESGKIFSREPDIQSQYVSVPQYEKATAEWYSQMRNVLERKLTTGPAEMVKAQIQAWARKGGFKKEELEWSGLLDWLDTQKKVARQDVLDYLDLNQVKVEALERDRRYPEEVWDMSESEYEEYKRYNPELFQDTTKFSEYQEPGGSNYKEMLLTLPVKMTPRGVLTIEQEDRLDELGRMNQRTEAESEEYNRLLKIDNQDFAEGKNVVAEEAYQSSHFPDDPNVLAHVRMNERTDLNGERVLFLEEVQSDWHQEGRRKGYRSEENIKEYEKRNKEAVAALSDIGLSPSPYDLGWVFSKGGETDTRSMKSRADRQAALERIFGKEWIDETKKLMDKSLTSDIPDAPFKKTWPLLAIKKIVRYAAENGFAKIAWTTGETQAARYDLSKQIDKVEYFHGGEVLRAYKNGETVIDQGSVTDANLEEYIGKDVAKKLLESDGTPRTLSGLDLKVGGEGLKVFYDHILPAEVNKFFNKKVWGEAKVEQVNFRQFDIGLSKQKGGGYVIADIRGAIDQTGYKTKEEAQLALKAYKGDLSAWSLPITPQMRQKALREGMPMFMAVNKGYLGNNTSAYELIRSSKKMDQEAKKSTGEGDIPPYWRIQGSSIRHSGIGERLSQKDAEAIMGLLRAHDFFGKYNPRTGTIQDVHREGSVKESQDLLSRLWQDHGSESIQIAKREAAEERQNMKEAAKDAAIASDLDRLSSEVAWIDQNLGEAEMNDYNKCTLAKYLAGEAEHLPMINWRWADPLQKLGAVKGEGMEQQADFESLKTAYMQACAMAEVDEEDYGPRM